jgi:hypothetical protein
MFSDVASPPCQTLWFEKCSVVDVAVSLSPEYGRQMVPIDGGDAKFELLPTVPRAIVAKEVCDFLVTFVVAFPGSLLV